MRGFKQKRLSGINIENLFFKKSIKRKALIKKESYMAINIEIPTKFEK